MTQEAGKSIVQQIVDELKPAMDAAPKDVQDFIATGAIVVITTALAFTAKFPENPVNIAAFKAMLRSIAKTCEATIEDMTRAELEVGLVNCEGTTTLQ